MPLKLSDLVLMSDLDGTLLPKGATRIPARNVAALNRFVQKGGRFGIATGRSMAMMNDYLEQVPVNFPCVLLNGGVIYEAKTREYLYELPLPPQGKGYIKAMLERFPDCGIIAVDREIYYDVNNTATARYSGATGQDELLRPVAFDALPPTLLKTLIVCHPEQTREVYDFAARQGFTGVRLVNSSAEFVEMLPEGCTKGSALQQLLPMRGLTRKNLVAIGDYYNDVEMLREAAVAATISTSPDEIKALAQVLTCPVEEGSAADLVEWLEARYGE